jgi:hypothetical protein
MRPAPPPGEHAGMSQVTAPELSLVIAGGRRVAELWCDRALVGILHVQDGTIVLRLESHAGGPLTVNAVACERALADAREQLAVAAPGEAKPGTARSDVSANAV